MRVSLNDITIHRGDTFTMDKSFVNVNNEPYVVSSELRNPFVLLTVSNSKYNQLERYLKNWWLDLQNYPRFIDTNVVKAETDEVAWTSWPVLPLSGRPDLPDGYAWGTSDLPVSTHKTTGGETLYYLNDAVFYITMPTGERKYGYPCATRTSTGTDTYSYEFYSYYDYDFRIVKAFLSEDTLTWIEKLYTYSIFLMSGQTVREYLLQEVNKWNIDNPNDQIAVTDSMSNIDIYNILIGKGVQLIDTIDYYGEYSIIDTSVPLLPSSKLMVLSTLNGGSL